VSPDAAGAQIAADKIPHEARRGRSLGVARIPERVHPARILTWPRSLLVGAVILTLIALFALLAPVFGDPTRQDLTHGLTKDGFPLGFGSHSGYPFGTDALGRDMLARLAYGARPSLIAATVANIMTLTVALAVGLFAGFYGGLLEGFLMRLTDVALAFPALLAALVLATLLPPGLPRVLIIITALSWAFIARLVYDEVLRLRRRGFVEASEAIGSRGFVTLRRHLVPHVLPVVLSYAPLGAAAAILFEASLSYLGAGINPPTASWGNMISDGQGMLAVAPHLLIEPGLLLALTMLAFILIGEGIKSLQGGNERASWLGL
jgi:ABC-type dipeptide/oligopeptide/nickel transport system permease subunit